MKRGISGIEVTVVAISIVVIIMGALFMVMAYLNQAHAINHRATAKATTTTTFTTTSTTTTTTTNSTTTTTKEVWGG